MRGALDRAHREAPFLRVQMERFPALVTTLEAGAIDEALAAASDDIDPQWPLAKQLRVARARTALVVAIGDLAGLLPLERVVETLSDLADRSLDRAISAAIEERTPGAPPAGFVVIALGKHGSRELNYSSDIDPILLFDPATLPARPREDPAEAAVRVARRVVELLQARDADGYAFRVDLRLRPSPEATAIALPVDAAIGYYESSALAWERAAFVRARVAAGDRGLGQSFLDTIRPFVWRRALDFGAIGEIMDISRRIRDHHSQGQRFGPGYDLKRGRGGIRECEFFAQIHQLIHGGREPGLRVAATMPALAALAEAARIDPADAATLGTAYRLYRTIEHRLQMVDDRQTHSLPIGEALDGVARLHGLDRGDGLLDLLRPQVEAVGAIYDRLDTGGGSALSQDADLLAAELAGAGFDTPAPAAALIARWRSGAVRAVRSQPARAALEAVLPALVSALGTAAEPATALLRLDQLLDRLPSAINFFRLLEARPGLARMLGDLLSHAPVLSDMLGRRPDLLDGLIDATALDPPPPLDRLIAAFSAGEEGDGYETILDRVRRLVGERRFALGAQLIEGVGDPIAVAAGYARVAEAAIETLAAATVADHQAAHGVVPDSEFVILALGRLGGEALTHASDLDLIFLFTGDFAAVSDGTRPLEGTRYYARLAQRVTAALSVQTAAGALYEVDTRLRPSGAGGLLAVSLDSFAQYQRENAWTWEHMALARARPVFGSPAARDRLRAIIDETLRRPRDAAALLRDAVTMRGDIAGHKPPAGPLDVKLSEGGLVDLEFCVHVAQLGSGVGLDPHLPVAIGALVDAGLLPPAFGEAHDVLTRMLVMARLVAPGGAELPAGSRALVARACSCYDWNALLVRYAAARQTVGGQWRQIVARSEEMQG